MVLGSKDMGDDEHQFSLEKYNQNQNEITLVDIYHLNFSKYMLKHCQYQPLAR